uniref:Uncharacterized protein n=1 Tax=Candidatus Kentrum sp. FM TaxID=2126340 RepID=A0A450SUA8_9GAMM|nr:MAG: hypothetical protein BECKFM1743C_GA0114222_101742 [Candidatus Kentron sp. FM]VFJ57570.1 MAG: hypothetical protein BECKFM1743A_GA0114220_101938 [Candidatus Kentron sp. FM]VFK11097.1 MAG: hypothetical protein BECKFM1743B_GA0114221_101672 [Candidatus Kentron sp. FM]
MQVKLHLIVVQLHLIQVRLYLVVVQLHPMRIQLRQMLGQLPEARRGWPVAVVLSTGCCFWRVSRTIHLRP